MRDRLIELLKNVPRNTKAFYDQFADYLLANGLIVPPCEVGDEVYVVYKGGEYYWQAEVLAVWTRQGKIETDTTVTVKFKDETIDTVRSEEVYTTKEETEKALKGGTK